MIGSPLSYIGAFVAGDVDVNHDESWCLPWCASHLLLGEKTIQPSLIWDRCPTIHDIPATFGMEKLLKNRMESGWGCDVVMAYTLKSDLFSAIYLVKKQSSQTHFYIGDTLWNAPSIYGVHTTCTRNTWGFPKHERRRWASWASSNQCTSSDKYPLVN